MASAHWEHRRTIVNDGSLGQVRGSRGYFGGERAVRSPWGAEQTIIYSAMRRRRVRGCYLKRYWGRSDPWAGPHTTASVSSPVDRALDRALALRRGEVRDRAADTRHSGVPEDKRIRNISILVF